MSDRDPRMLPGLSARTANSLTWIVAGGGFAIILAGIVVAGTSPLHIGDSSIGWILLVFVGYCGVLGAALTASVAYTHRRERREVDAGYTTVLTRYKDLDGLSPRTGQVVRNGVAPSPLLRPLGETVDNGSSQGEVDLHFTAWQAALRNPVADLIVGMAIVVFIIALRELILTNGGASTLEGGLLGALLVVALLALVIIPIFMFIYTPQHYFLGVMRTRFPTDSVWASGTGTELRVAQTELVRTNPHRKTGAQARLSAYIVASPERLTFWSRDGRRMLPFLSIPRRRIKAIQPATTINANGGTSAAARLSILKDDGSVFDFTMGFAPTLSSPAKMQEEMSNTVSALQTWHRGESPHMHLKTRG